MILSHAAMRASGKLRAAGTIAEQAGSARVHLGMNAQPGGRRAGSGGWPAIDGSRLGRGPVSAGRDASKATV